MRSMAIMLLALSATLTASAQSEDEGATNRRVKYAERTKIDFDQLDVKGDLVRPSGQIVTVVTGIEFESFVTLRDNFNAEMAESVDAVK